METIGPIIHNGMLNIGSIIIAFAIVGTGVRLAADLVRNLWHRVVG